MTSLWSSLNKNEQELSQSYTELHRGAQSYTEELIQNFPNFNDNV